MADNYNDEEQIVILDDEATDGSENDEFDGYEESDKSFETDEFDGYEESDETFETDEFDGYEESDTSFETDEFDGYEESVDYDEYDGYEEVDELSEFDENEEWDALDEVDGYDDYKVTDLPETKKTGFFTKLSVTLAALFVAAAVLLLITVSSKGMERLKEVINPKSEPALTLLDIGNELDSIELIGQGKFEEVFETKKVLCEEARKKALEESFRFDEKDSEKGLTKVSVVLSSVLKDLKIKVVNDNNKLIANVPFSVEVKDPSGTVTTFTDDNKDGIIYLEGLKGGKYSVKTLSVKGYDDKYSFADKTDFIDVKETLEYKKVDVSNEVKKENDVNVNVEDPGAKKPVKPKDDEDKPADDPGDVSSNDPQDKPTNKTFGIDVSKWNGNIDWQAVAASGVSYAIIRCGFRGSTEGGLIEDAKFYDNIKGATANGIKVGVYFFSQAVNEVEAVEEASMVLDMVSGYSISYPIFLDVETSGGGRGDQIGVSERTAVCKAFSETIRNGGYTPGIYSNKTWFEEKMNTSELTGYKIWLAQYAKEVTYTKTRYDMWQYSDSGSVLGISTGVDLNMSYLGY